MAVDEPLKEMRRAYLTLALADGVGPVTAAALVEAAGSAVAAVAMKAGELREVEGLGDVKAASVARALGRAAAEAEAVARLCWSRGYSVVCLGEDEYPVLLRQVPAPPPVLYVRGKLEPRDLLAVAIVGSRKCSVYGREQATRLAGLLAGTGATVVSGGALGIDAAAHEGALAVTGGRTIAVLGCGLDVTYPPEHGPLFDRIAAAGAIVSEYPPAFPPTKHTFPARNRIISGMSRGVIVVEADERSGALITARRAADDHNRPVFAVPGRIDNPLSAGPHALIRDGAVLVTRLDDILDELGPLPESAVLPGRHTPPAAAVAPVEAVGPVVSEAQRQILERLADNEEGADGLITATGLPAGEVMKELTFLTLRGLVRRVDGHRYALRR